MINIKKDLETIKTQIEAFKQEYINAVEGSIEQNPDIKIISINPKCFTIKFSDLSSDLVLSPAYYDFAGQADIIIAAIKQLPLERIDKYLEYVVEKEKLPQGTKIMDGEKVLYSGGYEFRINPKVATKLKEIIHGDNGNGNKTI